MTPISLNVTGFYVVSIPNFIWFRHGIFNKSRIMEIFTVSNHIIFIIIMFSHLIFAQINPLPSYFKGIHPKV